MVWGITFNFLLRGANIAGDQFARERVEDTKNTLK